MTDLWYYAEGEKTHGPVPLAELAAALAKTPDPRRTLVWQPGFPDWRPAELVPELADQLLRPPPLKPAPPAPPPPTPPPPPPPAPPPPVPPPSPPPASLAAPTTGIAGAARPAPPPPELKGIGGWLVLIAIGQVLGPVRMLLSVGIYYLHEFDTQLFESFPLTVYGEIALNVAFFAFVVCTAILFFRQSRLFPRFFILEWILVAALPLIDMVWVAVTASIATGDSFSDFVTLDTQSIGQIIAAVILGPIWIAYILRSRRVANTFVK